MSTEQPGREQRGPRPSDPAGDTRALAAPDGLAARAGDAPLLDQAFDASSMYRLRAALAAHAGHAGLTRARAEDLVVAVHEVAANVVRHGRGRGRLLVWRRDGDLICQVTEEGSGRAATAPAAQHGPDAPDAPDAPGGPQGPPWRIQPGHGLWLVSQLADHTSHQPGPDGLTTTITFRLRQDD